MQLLEKITCSLLRDVLYPICIKDIISRGAYQQVKRKSVAVGIIYRACFALQPHCWTQYFFPDIVSRLIFQTVSDSDEMNLDNVHGKVSSCVVHWVQALIARIFQLGFLRDVMGTRHRLHDVLLHHWERYPLFSVEVHGN